VTALVTLLCQWAGTSNSVAAIGCGHRANQVSDHKTVLHAYLAWVGHVA
jgi:hypothetical protein